ncbi:O-antigen ligase family protein [Anaeromyxobacter dehalogenans]|nr:O-antigen ligase family protein [Anaeromyxobacter dehalogenans]
MAYTLLIAAAVMWCAFYTVNALEATGVPVLLSYLTMLVAAIAGLYAAESFLQLGLRSEANSGVDPLFGLHRLRGPLFGSSIGGFVLLPALAYAVQQLVGGRQRIRHGVAAAVLFVAIFAMGSRSALLAVGVFVLLSVFALRGRARLAFIAVLAAVGISAALIVFSRASTERIASLEDERRAITYATAGRALLEAPLYANLTGLGYAAYWRWYLPDADGTSAFGWEDYMQSRPAGLVLYHPHSTPLLLVLELGLPGLMTLIVLAGAISRARRQAAAAGGPLLLLNGIAGSGVVAITDLLIFKSPFANLVWWTYLFGAFALCRATRNRPTGV